MALAGIDGTNYARTLWGRNHAGLARYLRQTISTMGAEARVSVGTGKITIKPYSEDDADWLAANHRRVSMLIPGGYDVTFQGVDDSEN